MTNSKIQPLLLLMVMVSFVFALFAGVQAQASVVSGNTIDGITSSRSKFNPRENGDITVKFSEKAGHEFQPGDVMELTLPMELKGYQKYFMLEDYAYVTVNENRVSVVFTEKVAKKNHIHGSLWFGVHASEDITKGTTKDVILDLGTQCQNVPTIKVKGYDAVSGPGDQKYAYKGGWVNKQDPTLIDWYIVINPQKLYMSSDVFLTDTLGAGHEYVQGSITANGQTITQNQGLISMGADKFSLQLRGDFVTLKSVEVRYQTKVNAAGMKKDELQNNFTANFQVTNRQPEYLKGSFKVKNVMFDGDIDGDDDLSHAQAGELPGVDETTDVLPDVDADKATDETVEDPTHKGTETTQEEVHVPTVEETLIEEGVVETKDIEEGKVIVETEDDKATEHATEDKPEQRVDPVEEEKTDDVIVPIPEDKEEHVTPEVDPAPKPDVKPTPAPKPDVKPTQVEKQEGEPMQTPKQVHTKDAELPKTGSNNNAAVAIAGLMLLVGTVGARRRFIK